MKKEWIPIDYDFKRKLPKQDCEIWITRVLYTGERFVQKVEYWSNEKDIEWDGTIAFMLASEEEDRPEPYNKPCFVAIQNVR